MNIIPEYELQRIINMFLVVTRENWNSYVDKEKTFLYKVFAFNEHEESVKIDKFDFFEQSQEILINRQSKRELLITIGYNMQIAEKPSIHITLPSESPMSAGIGQNEGFQNNQVIDESVYPVYTANSQSTYNLIITSENMNEVLVIYHWLRATCLSMYSQFELRGFQNVRFGGADMNIDDTLIPGHIFHRNFNISFTFDWSVPDILGSSILSIRNITGQAQP